MNDITDMGEAVHEAMFRLKLAIELLGKIEITNENELKKLKRITSELRDLKSSSQTAIRLAEGFEIELIERN